MLTCIVRHYTGQCQKPKIKGVKTDNTHLHGRRNAFSVAEDFVQVFCPQNISQSRLREQSEKLYW